VNPPMQPSRDQRRAATRSMLTKGYQAGAIIDGTTVFTFTPQPQTSAQSTTTTYNATFPGPDGRPKNTFIAVIRAVAGGGRATPRTPSHQLIHARLCSYHTYAAVFTLHRFRASLELCVAPRRYPQLEVHRRMARHARLQP